MRSHVTRARPRPIAACKPLANPARVSLYDAPGGLTQLAALHHPLDSDSAHGQHLDCVEVAMDLEDSNFDIGSDYDNLRSYFIVAASDLLNT